MSAETPTVADHTWLRRVGTGAYGDVWLAGNAAGILHAVKVIRGTEFSPHDYEPKNLATHLKRRKRLSRVAACQ